MPATVQKLFHFPIKGLSAQPLDHVRLQPGKGFPMDRAFGFARPGSGFDPDNPKPLPKSKFFVLARDESLATLDTTYTHDAQELVITYDGQSNRFDIATTDGRQAAARYLTEHLGLPIEEQPTLYSAEPHKFTDVSVVSPQLMQSVSLINLDSVADLSAKVGQDVDPARFRGNIQVTGLDPFLELEMMGQDLSIGEVRFRVVRHTKRCPATEVNLSTGERDLNVPALLQVHYGHPNMGVYLEVLSGGTIQPGDEIEL